MTPRKYKITFDQMRLAAARYKTNSRHPCSPLFEKLFNAMERYEYDARQAWPFVQELDKCLAEHRKDPLLEKKTTMYFLNRYLDQKKHKTK